MSENMTENHVIKSMRERAKERIQYFEKAITDPSKIPTLERIKANTQDYYMFEKIIIDGVGRGNFEIEPTEKEIKKYIDIYLLEMYEASGIQWVDAWDETHRENVRLMMESKVGTAELLKGG